MIVLARITGAFGLQGCLHVRPLGDDPMSWRAMSAWWLSASADAEESAWRPVKILDCRERGQELLVAIEGVGDRTAAEALRGWWIGAPRSALPATHEDEYYWSDLVGMEVVNCQGVVLGRIEDLISTGAHEVLCVRAESESGQGGSSGRERLLPFIASVVKTVDMQARSVCVDWQADW